MKRIGKISCYFSMLAFGFSGAAAFSEDTKPELKVNALAQAWLVYDTSPDDALSNFRVRRAELKFGGKLGSEVQWSVMGDLAKAVPANAPVDKDTRVLQDLAITWTPAENFEITLGQFKTQSTAEGLASSAELPLPERSLVGRAFGDKREPGIKFGYGVENLKGTLMVSNGQATNTDDVDNKKDLSLRLEYNPSEELGLGVFTVAQNFSYEDLGRFGANIKLALGALTWRAEGAYQKAGDVKSYGVMTDIAYAMDSIEPVARFELLKPATDEDVSATIETVGVNYYLAGKKTKIQAALGFYQNLLAGGGSPKSDLSTISDGESGIVGFLTFQAAY